MNNSPFQESIEQFIQHEHQNIKAYMKSLKSPYKDSNQPLKTQPSVLKT